MTKVTDKALLVLGSLGFEVCYDKECENIIVRTRGLTEAPLYIIPNEQVSNIANRQHVYLSNAFFDEYNKRLCSVKVSEQINTDNTDRYKHGEIECIDALRACLSAEEFQGFCKGNVIKYLWREQYKGGADDIKKAGVYLGWLGADE